MSQSTTTALKRRRYHHSEIAPTLDVFTCPWCGGISHVVDGRPDGRSGFSSYLRRRECLGCGKRWSTLEIGLRLMDAMINKVQDRFEPAAFAPPVNRRAVAEQLRLLAQAVEDGEE